MGDRTSHVARLIRRIIGDEMFHMGVVCNLLVAVGGRPRVTDAAPAYPGPLPGGVRDGVNVYLSGLTRPFVHDVMMAIEAPEAPLARAVNNSPSIGHFYDDLLRAFRSTAPPLSARGQLSQHIGSDVLEPVTDLDGVERAIEIIKEQGEGTRSSPRTPSATTTRPTTTPSARSTTDGSCAGRTTAGGSPAPPCPSPTHAPWPGSRPVAGPTRRSGWRTSSTGSTPPTPRC
ncbi:hypothetical protein STENM327S_02004 [Streptomyces tendae]